MTPQEVSVIIVNTIALALISVNHPRVASRAVFIIFLNVYLEHLGYLKNSLTFWQHFFVKFLDESFKKYALIYEFGS